MILYQIYFMIILSLYNDKNMSLYFLDIFKSGIIFTIGIQLIHQILMHQILDQVFTSCVKLIINTYFLKKEVSC